jgi:hypothetical protein
MDEPFGLGFYEWWAGLSPLYRYGVGLLVLILGIIVWYFDWGGPYFGGTLVAAAVVLFLLAGRSKDE